MRWFLVVGVAMVLLIFTPRIVLAVAVMHLALFGAVLAVRIDAVRVSLGFRPLRAQDTDLAYPDAAVSSPSEPSRPFVREPRWRPFVSIHVPAPSASSPGILHTLDSLARLDYEPLEVIVLDNSPSASSHSQRLEARCHRLGARFRFRRLEHPTGERAVALSECLQMTSPHSVLIATVDTDCRVSPSLVERVLEQLRRTEAARGRRLSHLCVPASDDGLALDGVRYGPLAQQTDGVLPGHGALTFVRRSALEAVGCWNARSAAPHAELGVRLWRAGFRGALAPRGLARAVVPHALEALRRDRRLRVRGHLGALGTLLFSAEGRRALRSDPRGALGVIAQLTAPLNFLFLPGLVLVGLALSGVHTDAHVTLGTLAAATLLAALAAQALPFALPPARGARLRALGCHLGLLWEGAVPALGAAASRGDAPAESGFGPMLPRLSAASALALTAPLLMLHGLALGALAMLLVAAGLAVGVLVLHRELAAPAPLSGGEDAPRAPSFGALPPATVPITQRISRTVG